MVKLTPKTHNTSKMNLMNAEVGSGKMYNEKKYCIGKCRIYIG